jgi:hypothetical protein
MTKSFLSVFMFAILISNSALACKPAPMPECKQRNLIINSKKYAGLMKLVEEYQSVLSGNIVLPQERTSCFDNHFAISFGAQLQEELRSHGNRTCGESLARVKQAVQGLIDPESEENKSVPDKKIRLSLAKLASQISREIKVLPRY